MNVTRASSNGFTESIDRHLSVCTDFCTADRGWITSERWTKRYHLPILTSSHTWTFPPTLALTI
jgi:hypothetical protein